MNCCAQARRLLGYAWASPCTLVGLALGVTVLLAGGRAYTAAGAWEFALRPAAYRSRLPFHAITLGHVILGTSPQVLAALRAHEQVHVRQYERWGPLFFLAYPAASLWQWLRGGRPYRDNCFEVEARVQSGEEPPATAPRKGGRPRRP